MDDIYISKQQAVKRFQEYHDADVEMFGVETADCFDAQLAIEIMDEVPAADVRPAVHGKWIYDCERTMGDGWTYKQRHCSECGYQTVNCDNFCQHCGADMREET